MGAVVNMRPDLFNAVIMGVPFVDVLTTMADETIPLTSIEWEEWGNPAVSVRQCGVTAPNTSLLILSREAGSRITACSTHGSELKMLVCTGQLR